MSKSRDEFLEILEPLVYSDFKLSALMGGNTFYKCQGLLFDWQNWLERKWFSDDNLGKVDGQPVGHCCFHYNYWSKIIVIKYGLQGLQYWANIQKKDIHGLRLLAVAAHKIESSPKFKRPVAIFIKPDAVNIRSLAAVQRADDIFENRDKYKHYTNKVDEEGNKIKVLNPDTSIWLPGKAERASPIFMWQVRTAYQINLITWHFYLKTQKKLKEDQKREEKCTV